MGGSHKGHHHHHRKRPGPPDPEALKRLKGYEAREREAAIGNARWNEEVARAQETGLPAADSIEDRSISTFARTELPHFAGINTFMGFPYVEDVREVSNYDVAVLGAAKQIGGAFLAFYLISQVGGVGAGSADEPIEQFLQGFELLFPAGVAIVVAFVLVVVSQMKINVTNAYAGSLAWSNFISRVFHRHPGRVWWVLLNVGIALALMLVGVFDFLNYVLGFYANVAIAWIGVVVADLLINKPLLKVSPSYIEFKRAHLYQFNPVGFGSMAVAVVVSISAFFGAFGEYAQAFSPYLAIGIAFVLSPALALATRGKYYIARSGSTSEILEDDETRYDTRTCGVCHGEFEAPDMASCPFHETQSCSLCCTLDSECHDMCKKKPLQLGTKPGAGV